MTECSFDIEGWRLRMTTRGMGAMARLAANDLSSIEPDLVSELEAGGVVSEGALHPRLMPLSRCVACPGVRVRLELVSGPVSTTDGWLDDRLAVLLRMSPAETSGEAVAVPRGMVPFRLARLVGLGRRSHTKVSDPVEIDEGLMEALLAPGQGLAPSQIGALLEPADEVIPEWLG